MKSKFKIIALTLTSSISFSLLGCSTPQDSTTTSSAETSTQDIDNETTSQPSELSTADVSTPEPTIQAENIYTDETSQAYLKQYFDIDISDEPMTAAVWNQTVQKIFAEDAIEASQDAEPVELIESAVKNAQFDELALSYTADKAKKRLKFYQVDVPANEQMALYLACALDSNLLSARVAQTLAMNQTVSSDDWAVILYNVADATGKARNFLGYSNELAIDARLQHQWDSFELLNDEKLTNIGTYAVENKISTGFNLKQEDYSAHFLPELTLQYGHSDIKHAHQLLALMNREDIVARVQLEPKVSAFEYLLEWGEPPAATDTYEVKKANDDLYIAYAVEYDLLLEFETAEEKAQFDEVVKQYAKKYEGNEEAKGLIYASWWQPLYTSTVEMQGDYKLIYDCVVEDGTGYSIHLFALPDNKEKVITEIQKANLDVTITPIERYCNTAFFEYLTGEDYQ